MPTGTRTFCKDVHKMTPGGSGYTQEWCTDTSASESANNNKFNTRTYPNEDTVNDACAATCSVSECCTKAENVDSLVGFDVTVDTPPVQPLKRRLDDWSDTYNANTINGRALRQNYEDGVALTLDMGAYSNSVFVYKTGCSATSVAKDGRVISFVMTLPASFKPGMTQEEMVTSVYATLVVATASGQLAQNLQTTTGDNSITIDKDATTVSVLVAAADESWSWVGGSESSSSSDEGLSAGALAGIVIGAVLGCALLAGGGFLVMKKMGGKGVGPDY